MKVVIVNYRYFVSGGPERYLFNLMSLLKAKGHTAIPFSIRYSKNSFSEYEKYFASPLSGSNEIYFRDQSWTVKSLLKTLERSFYSHEVYKKLSDLIENEKPDFAIVLAYLRKLSPSVLTALQHHNVPFAVRLSDFSMVCPNAHLIRGDDICELCIKGSLINSVRFKCVQNSYSASLINYISTRYHHRKKYYDTIHRFIVPSNFTKNKMVEAGWEENRLVHIPTFIYPEILDDSSQKKMQIIYVGRIEHIKGVHILLQAYKRLSVEYEKNEISVKIVGDGKKEYVDSLHAMVTENQLLNVEFVGNIEKNRLYQLLKESLISVAPSLWYDNMPNTVLESYACGTAVIAPDHGSFREIVRHMETGLLFHPGSPTDLADKIKFMFDNVQDSVRMGKRGNEFIKENHSPEKHYSDLMILYSELSKKS